MGGDISDDTGIALLFWPQQEFHQLLLRWPALAEEYGHTWEGYRAGVQRDLLRLSDSGAPRLALLIGAADQLATHAPPGDRYTAFTGALLRALDQSDPLTLDQLYVVVDRDLAVRNLPRPQRCVTNTVRWRQAGAQPQAIP